MALSSQPCAPTALPEQAMCGSSALRTSQAARRGMVPTVTCQHYLGGGQWQALRGRSSPWQGFSLCLCQISLLHLRGVHLEGIGEQTALQMCCAAGNPRRTPGRDRSASPKSICQVCRPAPAPQSCCG